MKITGVERKYAEEKVFSKGMKEKSREFVRAGAEV